VCDTASITSTSKAPPLPELAKDRDVACPVMAKAMIVTNEQLAHAKPSAKHVIDKFLCRVR
jgi:hypothetical protein